jgi:hypothetical protein
MLRELPSQVALRGLGLTFVFTVVWTLLSQLLLVSHQAARALSGD